MYDEILNFQFVYGIYIYIYIYFNIVNLEWFK